MAEPSTSASTFNISAKHIYETEDNMCNFIISTEKFPHHILNDCAEQKKKKSQSSRQKEGYMINKYDTRRQKNKNPPRKL